MAQPSILLMSGVYQEYSRVWFCCFLVCL